jgi:hypothetical protein
MLHYTECYTEGTSYLQDGKHDMLRGAQVELLLGAVLVVHKVKGEPARMEWGKW